ncbi:serine/threonine-protein kinase 32A isoform X1 [Microplitis mediator]|uniref:serine/threonine-protein kinase 32A isoform X1 n=1 Tax=Microplitis mediator TaxID=375433 RepID=UPI002554A023|nr:serine/threonine-protein kinase 32A isoform X1 [Microplitis mediator]
MGGHHSRSLPTPGEEVNFNHFQVLRAIGKGSFGKVCIVEKGERSGKMYAMKYVHKIECASRGALKNVTREVEIMSKLEHPFLVNLWFSFQDEEDLFMVTDLLLGGDLRYHIQQQVQFSEESVILFIAEIALALDYLKSKRIIHRDIKPDNILLDEEGHAHVTDFNVATMLEDDQLATSISGTKPYIAPEIYMCSCEVHGVFQPGYGYSVDWWSLGILAWETLEGVRPFPIHAGTSYKEALRILQDCKPVQPTEWSQPMSELLNSLLTLDPNQRLTTLCQLKQLEIMNNLDFDQIYLKKLKPKFTPSKNHLNCDPTFELEEMIIEARPLHKKKKRLAKQRSLRSQELADQIESPAMMANGPTSSIFTQDPTGLVFIPDFPVYNRERELEQRLREEKEKQWEEELRIAMAESEKKLHLSRIPSDRDKQRSHNQHLRNSSRLSISSSNIHSRSERASLRSNKRSGIATSLDIDFIDSGPETSTS